MAGFRETPRQKMIGMMYLVLTALLALNVSVQVLEAFVTVNESMEATNESFSQKINAIYNSFEQQNLLNPARVGPYYEKAIQVQSFSNDIKTKKPPISKVDSVKIEWLDDSGSSNLVVFIYWRALRTFLVLL